MGAIRDDELQSSRDESSLRRSSLEDDERKEQREEGEEEEDCNEETPHVSSYQWQNRIPSRYEDLFDDDGISNPMAGDRIPDSKGQIFRGGTGLDSNRSLDFSVLDSRRRLFPAGGTTTEDSKNRICK